MTTTEDVSATETEIALDEATELLRYEITSPPTSRGDGSWNTSTPSGHLRKLSTPLGDALEATDALATTAANWFAEGH